jgi:CRP/FNR family transcriptional regulator
LDITAKQAEELFKFLRPHQMVAVNAAAETVSYKPGEVVYTQGSDATFLYVVATGKIALMAPGPHGVDVQINELGPGKLFGVCMCLGVDAYTTTALCTEEAWLRRINAEKLQRLMDDDREIGYALEKEIARIYFNRYVNVTRRLSEVVAQVGAIHDGIPHNHGSL